MNYLSLKSLIAASYAPGEPQIIVSRPEQKAHMNQLLQTLTAAGIQAHSSGGSEPVLIVDVDQRHRRSYSYHNIYLSFSKEGVRLISCDYSADSGTPLSSVEQLQRVLAGAGERIELEHARELKRKKIRRLKERSIETQVEALARRLKFAYALEPMYTKLKLYVRISDQDTVVIDIPHKTLQETVDRLEPLLNSVRELAQVGLRFQMTRTAYIRFTTPRGDDQNPLGLDEEKDDDGDGDEEEDDDGAV